MPITKTVTLYTYDELSDDAKSKARDWWRDVSQQSGDQFYAEWVQDDFERVCDTLGIDLDTVRGDKRKAIFWSGFWSQGDGASFAGTFTAKPDAGAAIREYAPQDAELHAIGDRLAEVSALYPDVRVAIVQGRYGGHYVHENTMTCDVDVGEDENGDPLDLAAPIDDDVTEIFRSLARWLYARLETAYDDEYSDENMAENIRINEYTFTEDGRRED